MADNQNRPPVSQDDLKNAETRPEAELEGQKELVAHQANKTTLVGKDGATQKLVKVRALRNIDYAGIQMVPGEVREVPESFAKEFCAPIQGGYNFGGERGDATATRDQIHRAERV